MSPVDATHAGTVTIGGDFTIHRIGLGTNRIEDDDDSRAILTDALDHGVNFVDTADIYSGGRSETVIGQTIANDPRAHVATKGGYHGAAPEKIAAAIEASRARLRVEAIDLYYLHRPDPDVPIEQSVDPILSAKQDGRVRQIGLSNVTIDQLDRVRQHVDVAAVQNVYNLDDTSNEDVIDYCERNHVAFVPFFPLRGAQKAQALADRLGATRQQVVIAAMLKRSPVIVPIPGTRNVRHLEANLDASALAIEPADLEALGLGSNE
jgi:aryl-alcohol dehydrogenase-like predicted oxidoreductase